MKDRPEKIRLHGSVVVREGDRYTAPEVSEEESGVFLAYMRSGKIRTPGDREAPTPAKKRKQTGNAGVIRVDLERGMPTVKEALRTLDNTLQNARASGGRVLKLVHGYGSTGRGGAIRIGVRESLADMKKRGRITLMIPGEEFGAFGEAARRGADRYPVLTRDPDWGKVNQGITVVIL